MARYSFKSFRTFGRGPVPALFIALLAACGRSSPPTPTLAQKISTECLQPADKEYYFPNGTLDPRRVYDVAHQEEYSTYLRAIGAAPFYCGASIDEGYRFLWIPSNMPAGAITLERRAQEWSLVTDTFRDPRQEIRQRTVASTHAQRSATTEDAQRLLRQLESGHFWTMPASERSTAEDGSPWVLEGRTQTGYRVVTRRSLTDDTFKALGVPFFELAHVPLPR